jgi:hypothetical protein
MQARAAQLQARAAAVVEQRLIAEKARLKRIQEVKELAARIAQEQQETKERKIQAILADGNDWLEPPPGADPIVWAATCQEMAEILLETS